MKDVLPDEDPSQSSEVIPSSNAEINQSSAPHSNGDASASSPVLNAPAAEDQKPTVEERTEPIVHSLEPMNTQRSAYFYLFCSVACFVAFIGLLLRRLGSS